MGRRRDLDWRDQAAADLLTRHLPPALPSGPALVVEDPLPDVGRALEARGVSVVFWNRRAFGGRRATPWPPEGPFAMAALRLPKAKDELIMSLHAVGSVLRPGGEVLLYGAGDEGIQSALGPLQELFRDGGTLGIGGRCRVLRGRRPEDGSNFQSPLGVWRTSFILSFAGVKREWVSYPGIFAHGHLDSGTRLLLDCLPSLQAESRVLDFGCGTGIIGGVIQKREKSALVDLLDVDAVCLAAAKENVPGARLLLSDGFGSGSDSRYDLIVSNPPIHRGKAQDPSLVTAMVREAVGYLKPGGSLVLVVQRRFDVESVLKGSFRRVAALGRDPVFAVWEGRHPRG